MTEWPKHQTCKWYERLSPTHGMCVFAPPTGVVIITGTQPNGSPVYEPRGVFPMIAGNARACSYHDVDPEAVERLAAKEASAAVHIPADAPPDVMSKLILPTKMN